MGIFKRVTAFVLLTAIYGLTYVLALLTRIIPRRAWTPTGKIIVTGTFHNPNWYLSHIIPLTRAGVDEVILVVDEPKLPLEKVTFACPPKWLAKLLSRAGAKAIWMLVTGLRCRPDLYMGYHIAPGACSALVAGKLTGRPSCYQMTAGPVEIIGGGFWAIESMGGRLGRPSKFIERMALAVVGLFDVIVVRGTKAKRYLRDEANFKNTTAIITGSVQACPSPPHRDRKIDLISVGRLAPVKQIEQFVSIIHAIAHLMPDIRAVIVGDGPLKESLHAGVRRLGLAGNIEFLGRRKDVEPLLGRSKVFVLTSQSEGLSIAMIEAMACGAVPVVANVGELSDLVINGENGYLVEPNCLDEYIDRIISLLHDHDSWEKLSFNAKETARMHCDIAAISEKWRCCLDEVISISSNCRIRKAVN